MMDQLVQQGASMDINNDLGHSSTAIITATTKKESKSPRPKKSAERFKQLDENSSSQDELLRHQTKRQQDIARLAKRSAVKNNPLFKKFEQSPSSLDDTTTAAATGRKSPRRLNVPEKVDLVRKNSKGISSLKNKSYVTSSVFRQGESPSPSSSRSPSPSIPPPSSPEPSQQPDINTPSAIVKEEEDEEVATIEQSQPQTASTTKETTKDEEIEQQNESLTGKEPTSPEELKDVHSKDYDEKVMSGSFL